MSRCNSGGLWKGQRKCFIAQWTPLVYKSPTYQEKTLMTPEHLQVNEARGFNEKEYSVIGIEFDIVTTALPPHRLCV